MILVNDTFFILVMMFNMLLVVIDYARTRKAHKLVYIIFLLYFMIVLPMFDKIALNNILVILLNLPVFISLLGFTYWDLVKNRNT